MQNITGPLHQQFIAQKPRYSLGVQHGGVTFVHSSSSCFLLLVFAAGLEGSPGALVLVPIAGVAYTSFLGVSFFFNPIFLLGV